MRLSQLSIALLTVFTGATIADAAVESSGNEVEFNSSFLKQPGESDVVDVSRFRKGNIPVPGTYRADLYVNESLLGRTQVELRQVGSDNGAVRPCFDKALLERVGVDLGKLDPESLVRLDVGVGACLSLPELVSNAVATFDMSELRLDVSIPQVALSRLARGYVDPRFWDEGVPAAILQYNANFYQSDSYGHSSNQGYIGVNAGINLGAWRLRHSGNATYDDTSGTSYSAISTNLQRSIRSWKSQLVLGEAYTDGGVVDSFGFRGVRLFSDDRMYPQSQRGYAPTIHGIANTNARVQIRQNGNTIYETNVAPGPFEIDDLFPTGYGGDLEVVVTEADGSVHATRLPFAPVVNALRPGVTRYSVMLGEYRNPSAKHKPVITQAIIQHGVSNVVTTYAAATLGEDYGSVIGGIALNTDLGAIGFDVTQTDARFSQGGNYSGQSYRMSYSKRVEPTNTNLTLAAYRYSTSRFLTLDDAMMLRDLDGAYLAMRPVTKGRLQLTLNQSLPSGYGNFFLMGSSQDYWNRSGRETQFQGGYNNTFKRMSFGIAGARQYSISDRKWENLLMLNVGIPLGNGQGTPYSTTMVQYSSSNATSVQESISGTLGEGGVVGYGLSANHREGGNSPASSSAAANVSYQSPVATLNASVSKGDHFHQAGAGVMGGIVAYEGGVLLSPQLGDTIGVVEAGGASGARIVNSVGNEIGSSGRGVVPNLLPFERNRIEVDPKGLPLNVELKSTTEQAVPTAGAVVRVKFESEHLGRAALIKAQTTDGRRLPFGAEVLDLEGKAVGTVAQGGRIVLRGLKHDKGSLAVRWGVKETEACTLEYALPPEDESVQAVSGQAQFATPAEAICSLVRSQ